MTGIGIKTAGRRGIGDTKIESATIEEILQQISL
jgi:hypothetical protein